MSSISFGSFIIDDIYFPNGEHYDGIYGGAGYHATIGMKLWDDLIQKEVAIYMKVGQDHVDDVRETLRKYEMDSRGIVEVFPITSTKEQKEGDIAIKHDYLTPHAKTTFFENHHNDTRTFEFITNVESYRKLFAILPIDVPKMTLIFPNIQAIHICCKHERINDLLLAISANMKSVSSILYEPSPPSCISALQQFYSSLFDKIHIFSPNWEEACGILHLQHTQTSIARVCVQLRQLGAQMIVLRLGKNGSVVYQLNNQLLHIPSYPVEIVKDVTGAGNTYGGAFVSAWVHYSDYNKWKYSSRSYHHSLFAAALATISASFTIEEIGPAKVIGNKSEKFTRLERLIRHCEDMYEEQGNLFLTESNVDEMSDERIMIRTVS